MTTQRRSVRRMALCATVFSAAATCGLTGPLDTAGTAFGQVISFSTSSVQGRGDGVIGRRDLDLIDDTLNLDDAQREIIDAIHAGYGDTFDEESAAHRNRIQALYKNTDENTDWQALTGKVRGLEEQWQSTRDRLNEELLASIREILSEDQLGRWPVVLRDRRRRSMLAQSARFSAESVDLIDLVDGLKLEPDQRRAIEPTLNAWAEQLDVLLQARQVANRQWDEQIQAPMMEGNPPDPEKTQDLRKRVDQRSKALRDHNLQYAGIIPTQLSMPSGDRFRSAFNLAAYRRIYRPTAADRYIDAALALPDLVTEQVDAIKSIERDYDAQVLIINDQLAAIQRQEEDEGRTHPMGSQILGDAIGMSQTDTGDFNVVNGDGPVVLATRIEITSDGSEAPPPPGARPPGAAWQSAPAESLLLLPEMDRPNPDSPRGKLEQSKRELVVRTIDQVFSILTPAQQAVVPKPDENQMLSPEERMQRSLDEALSNAVITQDGDGGLQVELRIGGDDSPDN